MSSSTWIHRCQSILLVPNTSMMTAGISRYGNNRHPRNEYSKLQTKTLGYFLFNLRIFEINKDVSHNTQRKESLQESKLADMDQNKFV